MSNPLRILLVEDSDDDAALIQRSLQGDGRQPIIERVQSAPTMAVALATGAWDAILSDYAIPGFGGPEALHLLRESGRDIPFILISGAIGEERAAEMMRMGAKDFVPKHRLERLLPVIDRERADAEVRRQHRAAEQALRESEARFSQISALMGELIWEVDAQGLYTYLSPSIVTLLGYAESEVVGRLHYYDLHPEPGREDFRRRTLAMFEQRLPFRDFPNVMVAKDGRLHEILTNGVPILNPDGSLRGYRGADQDITEKRWAERSMARLVSAVEQTGDSIIVTDPSGQIEYVNPAFERSTGFSRVEAIGKIPSEFLRENQGPEFSKSVWELLRRTGAWRGRFTNHHKDGHVILHDADIAAIRGLGGEVMGFVSSQRDVTRQVELEAHLAQAERLEAIGTLAGGIAHDFNNVLAAIQGFTEVALQKLPPDSDVRRLLEGTRQASNRAAALVKQILAFSRQHAQDVHPVQVSVILKEAIKFIRATVPSSITIQTTVGSLAHVAADPTELNRIFVNLCTNAALAMSGGVGSLEVTLVGAEVDTALADRLGVLPGPYLKLAVQDSGCGMTPEVMARIFEPFFTTRPEAGGTGMGLAVIHGLLRTLQGGITVQSQPGRGSLFEVYLPICEAPVAPDAIQSPSVVRGTGSILFVDDEPMIGDMARDLIRELGYEVTVLQDPGKALDLFRGAPHAFDLVVTDMTMPGTTGDALATALRAIRPGIPLILCTGYSATMDQGKASAMGIQRLLSKPFTASELSQAIREALLP